MELLIAANMHMMIFAATTYNASEMIHTIVLTMFIYYNIILSEHYYFVFYQSLDFKERTL